MQKKRINKSIWLLLPLLVLRGLLPAGSMLGVTAAGSLSIVVCDSGVANDAATAHAEHHHGNGSAQHDHSICPFALSAAGAPAPSLPQIPAVAAVAIDRVCEECSTLAGLSGPTRAQQSRAPPAFS